MDIERFDRIAATLAGSQSRRGLLRFAGAAALAVASGGVVLEGASARRGKPQRCLRPGKACRSNKECCSDKTNYICAVQRNAGNSDKTCSGGEGAVCGGGNEDGDDIKPFCATGFVCSTNRLDPDDPNFEPNKRGVCERVPDEE